MTICKNCGKEIIKVTDRWYHNKTQKWHCEDSKKFIATPKPSDKMGESR